MGKKRKAGQRGPQKTFTPEHIDRIVAELLADRSINKWTNPDKNATRQGKMIPIRFTQNQYEVVMFICKQWNVTLAYLIKKLIVRQYFKESGWIEAIAKEIPKDVWDHLFTYAADRINTVPLEKQYKARTI